MFSLLDRNKTPLKQYNLIVTGTNWTTVRAIGIPYQTIDGAWRIRITMSGTLSAAATSKVLTFQGITFKSTSGYEQSGHIRAVGTAPYHGALNVSVGASTMYTYHTSSTLLDIGGDFELESKPSFVVE